MVLETDNKKYQIESIEDAKDKFDIIQSEKVTMHGVKYYGDLYLYCKIGINKIIKKKRDFIIY